MAVNVGQRNVQDNPQNRQLDACQKAMDLAVHTLRITSNQNIFKPEFQNVTDIIVRIALEAYTDAWDANNVYVTQENGRWSEREKLQYLAIRRCNDLLAMINVARRVFHLRGKKVKYWSQLAIDTRKLIGRWHEANAAQYKGA